LLITPSSQNLEPSRKPGRFKGAFKERSLTQSSEVLIQGEPEALCFTDIGHKGF